MYTDSDQPAVNDVVKLDCDSGGGGGRGGTCKFGGGVGSKNPKVARSSRNRKKNVANKNYKEWESTKVRQELGLEGMESRKFGHPQPPFNSHT